MPDIAKPVIPETITVHLGTPDSDAQNVTLSFPDYIKNVASSEIYPTWPEAAIRANIYAQVTFALNRVYTEWYRSRGYDFDITSSTQYDQAFVYGRDVFNNISQIVDEIFNNYVVRQGSVCLEPHRTRTECGNDRLMSRLHAVFTVECRHSQIGCRSGVKLPVWRDDLQIEGVLHQSAPISLAFLWTSSTVPTMEKAASGYWSSSPPSSASKPLMVSSSVT